MLKLYSMVGIALCMLGCNMSAMESQKTKHAAAKSAHQDGHAQREIERRSRFQLLNARPDLRPNVQPNVQRELRRAQADDHLNIQPPVRNLQDQYPVGNLYDMQVVRNGNNYVITAQRNNVI